MWHAVNTMLTFKKGTGEILWWREAEKIQLVNKQFCRQCTNAVCLLATLDNNDLEPRRPLNRLFVNYVVYLAHSLFEAKRGGESEHGLLALKSFVHGLVYSRVGAVKEGDEKQRNLYEALGPQVAMTMCWPEIRHTCDMEWMVNFLCCCFSYLDQYWIPRHKETCLKVYFRQKLSREYQMRGWPTDASVFNGL